MPTNQKADQRPISFILHNLADGSPPVEQRLVIRPEELTRPEQSRAAVTQTLGGAWGDVFGPGVPSVQISGTTGWGGGGNPDGFEAFQKLHATVYTGWHDARAKLLKDGKDPDQVKLIFSDKLDDFVWVVLPQTFVLRRSKSRPLLYSYQINLVYLSGDVKSSLDALSSASLASALSQAASMDSLTSALATIQGFADWASSGISTVLGPIKGAIAQFTSMSARVLGFVQGVVKAGMGVVDTLTGGLINIASNLARAGANLLRSAQLILNLPERIKGEFMRVAAAYQNAFCIYSNIFTRRRFVPAYDDLYGASNCSSTAGGRPLSRFADANPFPLLLPTSSPVQVSSAATAAVMRIADYDTVEAAPTQQQIIDDATIAAAGITVPS